MGAGIAATSPARVNQVASFMVELPDLIGSKLQNLADLQNKSPENIIAEAVQSYIEYQEKVHSFAAEARDIWNDFDASGRKGAIPLNTAVQWLSSWGK